MSLKSSHIGDSVIIEPELVKVEPYVESKQEAFDECPIAVFRFVYNPEQIVPKITKRHGLRILYEGTCSENGKLRERVFSARFGMEYTIAPDDYCSYVNVRLEPGNNPYENLVRENMRTLRNLEIFMNGTTRFKTFNTITDFRKARNWIIIEREDGGYDVECEFPREIQRLEPHTALKMDVGDIVYLLDKNSANFLQKVKDQL